MKLFHFLCCFLALFLPFSHIALSHDLNILIQIRPGKDFLATSSELKGTALINAKKQLMVQNAEIELNTLKTGNEKRDGHMKEIYFETQKPGFEKAVLRKAVGKDGKFQGHLVIRETPVKVEGTYKLIEGETKVEFQFETLMSDYKIKKASFMGVGALDKVQVTGVLPLQKK